MIDKLELQLEEHFGGVYALFNGAVCVYVGQSKNVPFRIREHTIQRTKSFDGFKYYFCKKREYVEKELISILRPQYNIKGNDDGEPLFWPTISIFDDIVAAVAEKYNNARYDKSDVAELFGCRDNSEIDKLYGTIDYLCPSGLDYRPSIKDIIKRFYDIKWYMEHEEPGQ